MSDHSVYAPSSAGIWLNCPASAQLSELYKEEDSEASSLGTIAHGVLEDCVTFGTEPQHPDTEIVEGIELALAFVNDTLLRYPGGVTLYVEKRLTIPNTDVWGTADLVAVSPDVIHIADYKHGWVPVDVVRNSQMLTYLAAAIAEFGPRSRYLLSVIQPRYYHKDGPIRTYDVPAVDLMEYAIQLDWSLANPGVFRPGKHCKYCKARGACKALAGFLLPRLNTMMDYDLTDRHTFDNATLAKMLDFLDMVPGYISAVKQEAFKRALQDRRIGGYKIVKGKAERKIADEQAIREKYEEWGIPLEALYDQSLVTPLSIEKQLKARFRSEGRGKWQQYYKQLEPAITIQQGGLTLVRDTDGRPQFNKGDEFGELPQVDGEVIL
jgi:hypothetical protein